MEAIQNIICECCNQISIYMRIRNSFELSTETNTRNISGDNTSNIDITVNNIFKSKLKDCNSVRCIGSEEDEKLFYTDNIKAPYMVCIDPIDGSKNIGVNITTGSIFSVYKYNDNLITDGNDIVMAGYCIYGACTQMVIAKEKVSLYQLCNYNFVKIKDDIMLPEKGKYISINDSYKYLLNNDNINKFIDNCICEDYNSRWVGCLVADAHRILMEGGVFLYPGNKKNKNGKIRLLYEAYPFAFIFKKAGGFSYNENTKDCILNTHNNHDIHQKVPIVLCGKHEYESYLRIAI